MESKSAFNEQILASLRPNFFELVAQEAMHSSLRPAFEYICKVLVQTRPDLWEALWRYCDELYVLLEAILQVYFIHRHSGSFSESFYCLRRVPCGAREGSLRTREKSVSLACLLLLPYVRVKLERLYWKLTEDNGVAGASWTLSGGLSPLCRQLFLLVYPYLHSLWDGVQFVFRVRYLFGQTDYYSPLLWLAGVTLSRQLDKDLPPGSSQRVAVDTVWRRVVDYMFPLGVFALKLLEWWYSSERSAVVRLMTSLPVPPPPTPIQPSSEGLRLPGNPQLCPLCLQRRTAPTTIATSGFVFCYSCILNYVRTHRQCPVTGIPTSEKQLIRLYAEQQPGNT